MDEVGNDRKRSQVRQFVALLVIGAATAQALGLTLKTNTQFGANDISRWCTVWSLVERARQAFDQKPQANEKRGGPKAGDPAGKNSSDGVVLAELACNLADRRESDLRPAEGVPDQKTSLGAGVGVRPIWYYLLASALVLTCWEWFLYHRRWID